MRKTVDFENNIEKAHKDGMMLMPNGDMFSMDGFTTRLNNNVIAMGTSGSSKTRSVLIPNLLSRVDSYVVSDPKGNLYKKYGGYLRANGYNVVTIDFIHPERSDGYNPLKYAKTPDEIMKLAHYLTFAGKNLENCNNIDPFWDRSAELLLSAMIGYLLEGGRSGESALVPQSKGKSVLTRDTKEKISIGEISNLLTLIDPADIEDNKTCKFDVKMEYLNNCHKYQDGKPAWSYLQYKKFRQTPPRTFNTVLTDIQGNLSSLDTPELNAMYNKPTLDFKRIGMEKTAVFVIVSDSDRSRDILVNTFYSQAMNALCLFADDECADSRLPVPVRFLLDDFGTNCRIDGFENMISNIRSRNISATIILQSVSQLTEGYGFSAHTIMDNCDTFIYMGGNDVETATTISKRANRPLCDILDMPVSTNYVFRRGQKPVFSRTIDIDEYRLNLREHETAARDKNAKTVL